MGRDFPGGQRYRGQSGQVSSFLAHLCRPLGGLQLLGGLLLLLLRLGRCCFGGHGGGCVVPEGFAVKIEDRVLQRSRRETVFDLSAKQTK